MFCFRFIVRRAGLYFHTYMMKREYVGVTRKPPTFKLAKVTVNAKLILQAVDDLEPLCVWMNDATEDHTR